MSKFKVWIDSPIVNSNVKDVDDFNDADSSKTQRVGGFQAGTPISSQYVNSALRQSTLVTSALMDLTGDTSLDYTSTTDAVKNKLQSYLEEKITGSSVYSSTYAQYSSSDTSKGTIEERLTNLGFKQGNIVDSSGDVVGTVTRQGNYVLMKFTKNIIVGTNDIWLDISVDSSASYDKSVFYPIFDSSTAGDGLSERCIFFYQIGAGQVRMSVGKDRRRTNKSIYITSTVTSFTIYSEDVGETTLPHHNIFGWEAEPLK